MRFVANKDTCPKSTLWVLGEMIYSRSSLIHFLHAIAAVIEVIGCAICGTLLNSVHLTRRSHMNHGRERGLGQAVEFVPPNLKAPEISGAFNQERDLLPSAKILPRFVMI